jgi:hypothetical protein
LDVAAWLRLLGLERYEATFHDNEITYAVLPELTDSDLKELGLPLGPRKLILKSIAALGDDARPGKSGTKPAAPAEARARDAERRQLTVMFIDLVGSAALSAQLDPEDMREIIRHYQNTVAGEITRFEGHIAKFMGDGVLAYFGWPRAHEDTVERAVRAGLAVVTAVARLRAAEGEPLAVRIGIATGLVVVGDLIGEGAAQEQAVVGDGCDLRHLLYRLQPIKPSHQRVVQGGRDGQRAQRAVEAGRRRDPPARIRTR